MSRPAILFPLFAGLESLDGIGKKTAQAFEPLGVTRPKDLLYLLPQSGVDRGRVDSLSQVLPPGPATVEVLVKAHYPPRRANGPYRVLVQDSVETWTLVFFRARADFVEKQLPIGERRLVSGKFEYFEAAAQMVHPDHILPPDQAQTLAGYEPVYPLTAGVTQKLVTKAARSALALAPDLAEWIDPGLLAKERWPSWKAAMQQAHSPANAADLAPTALARARLAYDELFAHQLTLALARATVKRQKGRVLISTRSLQNKVLAGLPYKPTAAQSRAVAEIAKDMAAPLRMNRLLQGDVGAGKTLVAFLALLVAIEAGGQGVLMAPTEILARQHYDGLKDLAALAGVRLELLTGRDRGPERRRKLEDLASGRVDILLGTHAVFQKDVHFHDLGLIVVDEQHRFGVMQRQELAAKGQGVDVLVMTATPIPRSLALASYGDMDVSILDEKPPGRQPISTALISLGRLDEVVSHLKQAVDQGKQAYWVCPLVEESEFVDLTSAEARFEALVKALGAGKVGLVHGQMPPSQKDAAMARFIAGETSVLVSTTVIEVGVNVPKASIMVIERAENFGLAQLHQLRGRVGRGSEKSTCLLLYQAPLSGSGERRLKILRDTEDGFRIADEDLQMRGAGDLIGTAQSGLPKFRIADLEKQAGLMALAQSDARKLLNDDASLTSPRGQAARHLLWLLEQDRAIGLISVG